MYFIFLLCFLLSVEDNRRFLVFIFIIVYIENKVNREESKVKKGIRVIEF